MKLTNLIKRIIEPNEVLFADLDGTIIKTKSGYPFAIDRDDWEFKQGIISAIRKCNPKYLHIVSNQGGIELGYIKTSDFEIKKKAIVSELSRLLPEIRISFDYCTSNNEKDGCRKPNPGMINVFLWWYDEISRRKCLMIGDASGLPGQFSDSDKKCAENAGIRYMDVDDFIKKYR